MIVEGYAVAEYHYETAFTSEDNGTWTMGFWNYELALFYIKTRNTPSGKVQVHMATRSSRYQQIPFEHDTVFTSEDNGVWTIGPTTSSSSDILPDLYYIKTQNVENNLVEVHIAAGTSAYAQTSLQVQTTFSYENDGVWGIASQGSGYLGFIKTANTGTGTVELHISPMGDQYRTRSYEAGTNLALGLGGTWGWFYKYEDNLPHVTRIQPTGTNSGYVEWTLSGYGPSAINLPCEDNGIWKLYYIDDDWVVTYVKTRNTANGKVEVHIWGGGY
jgi:hypothetical protein